MLDASAYSIRVPRADMPRLLEILRAIPANKVATMQRALRRAWPRFSYLGNAASEARRRPADDIAVVGGGGIEPVTVDAG